MTGGVRGYRVHLSVGLLLALTALLAYYPVLGNFFTWDDFLWLYRVRNLASSPAQMFSIDAVYFDPLVYIWFWIDYSLHGLNYFWYHLSDISLHALNGFIIYLLMRKMGSDTFAALAGGTLFLVSSATVDAVAWSSSRVDLLAVCFSLLTILLFLRYLHNGGRGALASAVGAFILALASKGTPLFLPVILVFLLLQRGERAGRWWSMAPFAAVMLVYVPLLTWRLSAVGKQLTGGSGGGLNFRNLLISFSELVVPERLLSGQTVAPVALVLAVVVGLSCRFIHRDSRQAASCYLLLTVVGLAPVLILKDFKLVTSLHDAGYLLSSPSHRIYLASAGISCFFGLLLSAITRKSGSIWLGSALLLFASLYSVYEVRVRQELWKGSADYIRKSVEGVAAYRTGLVDQCAMGLVNFPMSRGFMRPALALYCGLENVLFLPMVSIPRDMLDSPEIFRYRNRGFFFIFSDEKVINLSETFNKILDIAFFYQVSRDERERSLLMAEYRSLADRINTVIASAPKSRDFEETVSK
jgi:hypothetical protein